MVMSASGLRGMCGYFKSFYGGCFNHCFAFFLRGMKECVLHSGVFDGVFLPSVSAYGDKFYQFKYVFVRIFILSGLVCGAGGYCGECLAVRVVEG